MAQLRKVVPLVAACALTAVALTGPASAQKPPSGSDVGTGRVFEVNPVQSTGIQSLTDQKDSAGAVPLSAYATVPLRNLDGSGRLVGRWVNVRSNTGPAAYSPTNTFLYRRDDDRFEQVMAYFWVNQAQEYLQSLGFGTTLRPVNAESQDVRVDQYGIDNSYSWDKHDYIRLGKGGVDDAEDAEVIVHEYGHAVHDAQVPGFGSSLDAGAIGEAFGDYLAVTVGLDAARQYGWPVRAPRAVRHGLGRHVLHLDRAALPAPARHRPGARGPARSGALRRGRSGATRCGTSGSATSRSGSPTRDWDRTLVDSQFGYAPGTSFSAAARATYREALANEGTAAAAGGAGGVRGAAHHVLTR